jgi:hypothetical protein
MPLIYWFSRRMTLWGSISFNLAVFINIIIAFFYPYVEGASTGEDMVLVAETPEPSCSPRLGQSFGATQALRGPDAKNGKKNPVLPLGPCVYGGETGVAQRTDGIFDRGETGTCA